MTDLKTPVEKRSGKRGATVKKSDKRSPSTTEVVSLQPPSSRRRSWVVAGVLMVALAGLLGAWLFSASTDTMQVTTAARDLKPGEQLERSDIRIIQMGRSTELKAVTADQQDLIVGQRALAAIPAGTVLNTGLFTDADTVVPDGFVVVGATLQPGAVPVNSLTTGQAVMLFNVDTGFGEGGSSQQIGEGTIWTLNTLDDANKGTWVSLLVSVDLATAVTSAAGSDTLRLALLP